MSGINSTIRINDGMSPALKSMNKALNIVLSSFEKLQSTSANSIDTSDIVAARAELNNAAVAVSRLEEELEQAENAQEKLTKEAQQTESVMSGLIGKVGGLIAAYASAQTLMGAVNLSDKVSQTESRLNLIVDEEAGESVDELTEKIMDSANRSRSSYLDTASVVASFAQRAGDAFNGNDEVIAFAETLNKMYVIAGATAEEQSSSMLQLTQALGSGVLRGEEFNAVFEAAPNIMQSVADYMNIPIGKLRDMASEGLITADVVKNAIFSASEEVNADFESMNMTWSQVMTLFKNQAIESLDPVLRKINELANNKDVQNFAIGVGAAISSVATVILWVFELVAGLGSFIYNNWSYIAPIVYAVVAALAVYYGIMLLVKGVEIASAIATGALAVGKGLLAAATMISTGATWAAVSAQYGLNAAMYACPIVWIIALILLVVVIIIAAIIGIIKLINWLTGSTISAVGMIAGNFMVGVSIVWNLFLALLDLILGIVNNLYAIFASFVNFFANVFNDPIGSIIRLFGDLADSVLGVLESIARAMDKLFGSSLADTVAGWREGLDEKIEIAAETHGNGSYEEVLGELNLSSDSLGLSRMEYGDSFNSGYEWGAGIESSLGDAFSGFSMDSLTTDGLVGDVGDIADNTGSISDSMEVTDEDLKYLRDIAEQEAVNRFTTAEIRIDMQNNNSINSNMDIDGIVSQLEDRLYESMEIAAEGVH